MTGPPLGARPRCWRCGQLVDGYTGIKERRVDEAMVPDAGSVSICLYCTAIGVFVASAYGLTVRRPTAAEGAEYEADPEIQFMLEATQQVQRAHLRRRP